MYGEGIGEIAWMDLSVNDAEAVSQFYQRVLGWSREPVAMTMGNEKYSDFVMTSVVNLQGATKASNSKVDENPHGTSPVNPHSLMTGICHAKGENKDMPAVWLPYFLVKNLDESVIKIAENGGSLATKIKNVGDDRYIVFKDPAGALAAIYQKSENSK